MLFESTEPTPELIKELLLRSLNHHSTKPDVETQDGPHVAVPAKLIALHGELDHRLRYAYNSVSPSATAEQLKVIRELKRQLDLLPSATIEALQNTSYQGWMQFFKILIKVHQLCVEAKLFHDSEEYERTLRLLTQLAKELVCASPVQINAASLFSLMLLENHMHGSVK